MNIWKTIKKYLAAGVFYLIVAGLFVFYVVKLLTKRLKKLSVEDFIPVDELEILSRTKVKDSTGADLANKLTAALKTTKERKK